MTFEKYLGLCCAMEGKLALSRTVLCSPCGDSSKSESVMESYTERTVCVCVCVTESCREVSRQCLRASRGFYMSLTASKCSVLGHSYRLLQVNPQVKFKH